MSQFSDEIDVEFQKWTAMMLDKKDAEITRLRAELAAVTAERDRMRDALKAGVRFVGASDDAMEESRAENERLREALRPFSDAASIDDYIDDVELAETDTARKITFGDLRRARAALEGVTEKEGEGNE